MKWTSTKVAANFSLFKVVKCLSPIELPTISFFQYVWTLLILKAVNCLDNIKFNALKILIIYDGIFFTFFHIYQYIKFEDKKSLLLWYLPSNPSSQWFNKNKRFFKMLKHKKVSVLSIFDWDCKRYLLIHVHIFECKIWKLLSWHFGKCLLVSFHIVTSPVNSARYINLWKNLP